MSEIQSAAISNALAPSITTPKTNSQNTEALVSSSAEPQAGSSTLHISGEAQYLLEVDNYLANLNESAQGKALEYLSQSNDPLQNKAVVHFAQSQIIRTQLSGQTQDLLALRDRVAASGHELDAGFQLNDSTKVVAMPQETEVFRLDGKKNFYPVQLNTRNTGLTKELDAVEKTAYDQLDNQDAANLIGSVRYSLNASENIMLSADDVIHLQYSADKAREAIRTIDAPANIKSKLTEILNKGLNYQNEKQTQFISDTQQFVKDDRIGGAAVDDVRLATAAQKYNNELRGSIAASNSSVLNSGSIIKKLLMDNSDLVRFTPDKVDEALTFYKQDFSNFQKVLKQDYSQPEYLVQSPIDKNGIELGSEHAMNVIRQIKSHASLE